MLIHLNCLEEWKKSCLVEYNQDQSDQDESDQINQFNQKNPILILSGFI